MAISLFFAYPFIPSNRISRIDTATGSNGVSTYPLKNNTAQSVGADIQVDAVLYKRFLNGFTFPDNTDVTLSVAPQQGAQIVIPGQAGLTFTLFDQVNVPGAPNSPSNVAITKFYLADDMTGLGNVLTNSYQAVPGTPGIAIYFANFATAAGAQVYMTQLACADANGNALTFQATGTTLYTDNIWAYSNLLATAASSMTSTTIQIDSASANGLFYPGDYIYINPGGTNQENVPITAVNYTSNTLTVTGLNFNHNVDELVIVNGRPFYGKVTLPIGYLQGYAQTLINVCPVFDLVQISR